MYDVHTKAHESITFPVITSDPDYHVSGVDFDVRWPIISIYFSEELFADTNETRTEFPFVDITARVKALHRGGGISS